MNTQYYNQHPASLKENEQNVTRPYDRLGRVVVWREVGQLL